MKTIDPETTKCDKRSIRIIKFDKKEQILDLLLI
jgi:hypothetical protein